MANVAQLVRAPDCDSGGRRFDPGHSPHFPKKPRNKRGFFVSMKVLRAGPDLDFLGLVLSRGFFRNCDFQNTFIKMGINLIRFDIGR